MNRLFIEIKVKLISKELNNYVMTNVSKITTLDLGSRSRLKILNIMR